MLCSPLLSPASDRRRGALLTGSLWLAFSSMAGCAVEVEDDDSAPADDDTTAGDDDTTAADDDTTGDDDDSTPADDDATGDDDDSTPSGSTPPPEFFGVVDQDGAPVSQADLLGSPTVLWFYPLAASSG